MNQDGEEEERAIVVRITLLSSRPELSSRQESGDADALRQRTGKGGKPNEIRVTTPYMTKYERARVLGTRALQIR